MTENELRINGKSFDETISLLEEFMESDDVHGELFTVLRSARDFMENLNEEIQQYRAIGTVEQLKTMFDGFWKLKDLCEEYEKFGLPEDYWKLNEMCKEYSAIGTIEEFKALKKEVELYRNLDKTNFSDGYNKAIDEFADKMRDICKTHSVGEDKYTNEPIYAHEDGTWHSLIDEIAERMKEGAV